MNFIYYSNERFFYLWIILNYKNWLAILFNSFESIKEYSIIQVFDKRSNELTIIVELLRDLVIEDVLNWNEYNIHKKD